jgi:hypothetical protein
MTDVTRIETFLPGFGGFHGCVCRKLDSEILMVKAAKDRS